MAALVLLRQGEAGKAWMALALGQFLSRQDQQRAGPPRRRSTADDVSNGRPSGCGREAIDDSLGQPEKG